jgi:hypothetical protein
LVLRRLNAKWIDIKEVKRTMNKRQTPIERCSIHDVHHEPEGGEEAAVGGCVCGGEGGGEEFEDLFGRGGWVLVCVCYEREDEENEDRGLGRRRLGKGR